MTRIAPRLSARTGYRACWLLLILLVSGLAVLVVLPASPLPPAPDKRVDLSLLPSPAPSLPSQPAAGPAPAAPAPAQTASAPAEPLSPPSPAPAPAVPSPETTAPAPAAALQAASQPEPPAWLRNARAFTPPGDRPRVSLVVQNLGLAEAESRSAIEQLPAEVGLSFSPYAADLPGWLEQGRRGGHELLLDLPMEPADLATADPGPKALMTSLSAADNRERLAAITAAGQGLVGVTAVMGGAFLDRSDLIEALMQGLLAEGLLLVDSPELAEGPGSEIAADLALPRVGATRLVDLGDGSEEAVMARLAEVERIAVTEGGAVALARPRPATLAALARWIGEIEGHGLVLAPVTALARKEQGGR